MSLVETLNTVGIRAFGSAMPVLAPAWASTTPTEADGGLALALAGGTWSAPLAGFVQTPAQLAERAGVRLRTGDGSGVPDGASVVSLYPQQSLRLARLYALLLEDATSPRPGRAQGLPARPVPAHVVLAAGGVSPGGVDPGDDLGVAGQLSFHDQLGQPIDPLAVAAAFLVLMRGHPPLQQRGASDPFQQNPPLAALVTALAPTAAVRIRVVDGQGAPRSVTNLTGLTAVDAGRGLAAVTSGGLGGTVAKAVASGSGGAFPDEVRRTLVLGLATTGRMGNSVTFPALPAAAGSLARDFFTLRVVDLRSALLGTPSTAWEGARLEPRPAVRRDEPVQLLSDGNDVLGAASASLTGATVESIAVAPVIDGAFASPPGPGAAAHWPAFPAPSGTVAPAGPVPATLRDGFAPLGRGPG